MKEIRKKYPNHKGNDKVILLWITWSYMKKILIIQQNIKIINLMQLNDEEVNSRNQLHF